MNAATTLSVKAARKLPLLALAVIIAVVYLVPFYIIVRNALMTRREIASFDWILWPEEEQWQNYDDLFDDPVAPMAIGLRNSALVSLFQVGGQLLVSSLAGYALARIPYRWADAVFYFILGTLMVPAAAIFVQTFVVVSYLGWINTLQGIIVPGMFYAFFTFIFRQFFLDFPVELEDAARVDGLGYIGIFWRIVVPNSVGVFLSLGTLGLIRSWNAEVDPLLWRVECGRLSL